MKLAAIAERLGCRLEGDGDLEITGVSSLQEAEAHDISFLANARYAAQLAATRAGAVILPLGPPAYRGAALRSEHPYLAFAAVIDIFCRPLELPRGIDPTARIAPSARLGSGAAVGPYAVVGEEVTIGERAQLFPHVVIYPHVRIGNDFTAHASAVIREGVTVGDRVTIHAGAVIGSDGFGYIPLGGGRVRKIVQAGRVVIEDDVDIGANTTVDRATAGTTTVRRGAKLDNLVMVGHGSEVGEGSLLAAQVGLAGSTRVGREVQMGGQAGAAGHLTIGDGARVAAQSGVPNAVPAAAVVAGYPAIEATLWRRAMAVVPRLPEVVRRLRQLERKLGEKQA